MERQGDVSHQVREEQLREIARLLLPTPETVELATKTFGAEADITKDLEQIVSSDSEEYGPRLRMLEHWHWAYDQTFAHVRAQDLPITEV